MDSGMDSAMHSGMDSGMDYGRGSGMDSGMASGMDSGMDFGMDSPLLGTVAEAGRSPLDNKNYVAPRQLTCLILNMQKADL